MVILRFTILRTKVWQWAHGCPLAHCMQLLPTHLVTPLLSLVVPNLWRVVQRVQVKCLACICTFRVKRIQLHFTDILYFDPITEQFQVMEQKMSIGRSNHLIFALGEFPTGVCSQLNTPEPQTPTSATSFTTASSTTSSATALPPQCFVAGECEGDLIGIFAGTVGVDDCLAACRNTSGCVWFTEYEVE